MPISRDRESVYGDLQVFNGWKGGITNLKRPSDIDQTNELLDAVNVDLSDSGKIRVRQGLTEEKSGEFSNLFSYKNVLYGLSNTNFVSFDNLFNETIILSNINKYKKMYYLEVNDELYFSNGEQSGKINKYGSYDIWSVESPLDKPAYLVEAGGLLPKGTYIIAYSYLYGTYETGISPIEVVKVNNDNSKITINTSANSISTGAIIYAQQGEVLYQIGSGYSVVFENTIQVSGKTVKSENSKSFPMCENLAYYKARIYGSFDSYLTFTDIFDYRQFNPTMNFVEIDGTKILSILPYASGLFIITENSIWKLEGDSYAFNKVLLENVKTIKGTEFKHERKQVNGILTTEGVILFAFDGKYQNVSETKIDFSKYESGSALFKMQDGIQSVIFSLVGKDLGSTYRDNNYENGKIISY